MSKKAVVLVLAVCAIFVSAEDLSLQNDTTTTNETISKRADVMPPKSEGFMSKLASWIFPFGGGDSVASETQHGGVQYLPPSQNLEGQDCNPCNKEPWIPVATNYGKNTIIGFMHPSEFSQAQLKPPFANGQNYGVPFPKQNLNFGQTYGVPNNFGHNVADNYGPPSENYGPPIQNLKPPAENYGQPTHVIPQDNYGVPNNIIPSGNYGPPNNPVENYGPPVQNLKPPTGHYGPPTGNHLKPPVENFGTPEKLQNYGPPITNNLESYGHPAPVENFGPLPTTYGPPSKTYGIPQTQPLPTFGPPPQHYGPPPPGPPKPFFNPPKPHFGPVKTHNIQKPRHVYGGPREQPSPSQYTNQYRPPPPKFKQGPKFGNFAPTLATNMRPPPFNPQNLIPSNPQNNVKFPNPDYIPPRVQLPLSQNHPAHLLKPIPLPNLSAYPMVPLHGPQDFRKGSRYEASTNSYYTGDGKNNYNIGDGYTNQPSNSYNGNGGDVQIQQSIAVADYVASIEHPINVIHSPILEVDVANTSSHSDFPEEGYRDLSNQPTNYHTVQPETPDNFQSVTIQPEHRFTEESLTVNIQPTKNYNTVHQDHYNTATVNQGNYDTTSSNPVKNYITEHKGNSNNYNIVNQDTVNNQHSYQENSNLKYNTAAVNQPSNNPQSQQNGYNSPQEQPHIEIQNIDTSQNNNFNPNTHYQSSIGSLQKGSNQEHVDSYPIQAQQNFVTTTGNNVDHSNINSYTQQAQLPSLNNNPKYYNNLNNHHKLSQNPIVVDDTHTAESTFNGTIQNHHVQEENKTYHQGAFVNADLINQIIKGVDFKETNQFTKPEIDYSDWLPNQELSTEMIPPPEGQSFWLSSPKESGVEVTTKKPKQIQIIIPYTTNTGKVYDKNLGRKVGPNTLPLHTQPPSFESVWSEHTKNEVYKTSPSNEVFTTKKVTTPVINIKDLLKANQAEHNYKNLPFDIIRFQKNIDDWTEQEYAHKMLLNLQKSTSTTRLVPSKKIPEEYLTTQPYNPREFEATTHSAKDLFDHEPAGTNSKEYKYKDELDDESNEKEEKYSHDTESNTSSELEHNFIGTDSTVGVDVTTERQKGRLSWDKIQIAVSPLTKEKVYVVTPQPKLNSPTESWKNANLSTTFSINILPMRNASDLNDVRIVLSEWPHLINNLETTTSTSTTRPKTSRHPLFGLMDLSSYAPPDNATIQTYSGHSKVINAASSSTKKKPSGVEEKATIKTTTQKIST